VEFSAIAVASSTYTPPSKNFTSGASQFDAWKLFCNGASSLLTQPPFFEPEGKISANKQQQQQRPH